MKISEIMTTDVLTVSTETPLKEVARTLSKHEISGVPVVGADNDGDTAIDLSARRGLIEFAAPPAETVTCFVWCLSGPGQSDLGFVRSTNGRMCRQPTEQCPYQPASSPCLSRISRNEAT